jgi:single-stranded-DNA-specific exonuclease
VIGFGLGDRLPVALRSLREGLPLEAAFCVDENRWNGRSTIQLEAKDLRLAEPSEA